MRKYHPDYLGHNEYITDKSGRPYQHFHYSAFGESLIEKNTNYGQFSSPYRFNGKELDPETGNYYYGERYYNPTWSVWLGVDPLAHEYPSVSPFVFTGNNPIMLVDPDGMQIDPASQDEWDGYRESIVNRINLYKALNMISVDPDFSEFINSLENTLGGMDAMADEDNLTVYKLAEASGGIGGTYMNDNGEVVFETNGSTENFIHEVNHGIQYENNSLGFFPGTKSSVTSIDNEVKAYRAEFAYSRRLAEGINPNAPKVTSSSQITSGFVRGIVSNGKQIYNNTRFAITPINPDMGMRSINQAWPGNEWEVQPHETLRSIFPMGKWKQ